MGLFSFLKKKKPEEKIPVPPSPPGEIPKPVQPKSSALPSSVPPISPSPAFPKPAGRPVAPMGTPKPAFPGPELSMRGVGGKTEPSGPMFPDIPKPKSSGKSSFDIEEPMHVDDFGIPEDEGMDLPDIETPKFAFPAKRDKEEIKKAIEVTQKPGKNEMKDIEEEHVPEELPSLGEPASHQSFEEDVEEPFEMHNLKKSKGPVFVRSDRFMLIKKGLSHLKDNMKNVDNILAKINDIKNRQDADLDSWHSAVEAIQRKLVYIDKTVFEKG